MKTIPLKKLRENLADQVDAAQKDAVVVTRHGEPAALIIGIEGLDMEDIALGLDEGLWRTLAERRKSPHRTSWEEAKRRLKL